MTNASFLWKYLSGSLEAAKNILVKSLVNDSTKHETAVIIIFFAELFEVKRNRDSCTFVALYRTVGRKIARYFFVITE